MTEVAPGDLDENGDYIGHNNGTTCTSCHTHVSGFSPSGGTPAAPHDTQPFVDNCIYCHVADGAGNVDFAAVIPDSQCEQCHTPLGVLKSGFPAAPNVVTHSAVASGTEKYVYNNSCVDCHNPMYEQTNLKGILSTLPGSVVAGSTVEFTAVSGTDSLADGPPFDENVCEICHTMTNHHRYDGSAPADNDQNGYIGHFDGQQCTQCHTHLESFAPGWGGPHPQANTDCSICHLNQETGESDLKGLHNNNCQTCHVSGFDGTFLGPLGTWDQECSGCHNPSITETRNLQTPTKGHRCVVCHGEQRSTTNKISIHADHTDKTNCVVCHSFTPSTNVQIGSGSKENCHLCHDISMDDTGLKEIHKKMVPKGTSCQECHADGRPSVDVFPGDPVGGATVVCEICHSHQSPNEFRDRSEDLHRLHLGQRMDCGFCHADAILQDDQEPMPDLDDDRRMSARNRDTFGVCFFCHRGDESADCMLCHTATSTDLHKRHVSDQWQWCYNCHDGDDQRPTGALPPVTQPAEACIMCHVEKVYNDTLPIGIHEKHASRNKCYSCHQTIPQFFYWPDIWLSVGP
jgi:hypothetical protein